MSAARRGLRAVLLTLPAALVVLALMVLLAAAPAAASAGGCDHGLVASLCQAPHAVAGTAGGQAGPGGAGGGTGAAGVAAAARAATHAVDGLDPQNFLESWAQGLAHAVVFELSFIQTTVEKLGTPAFDRSWWIEQYAVSFGLAMLVLPFLLAGITARTAGPEGGVTGVALLRRSGWRMVFVVPACAMAPAVLYSVTQLATGLERTFSTPAAGQGDGAVGGLLRMIQESAGKGWSDIGGTVMAILMFALILALGTVLVVEVFVAEWGVLLIGLLLPLALVAAVYPPWGRLLRRICGLLGSLLFLPAVILFFFWTLWAGFNAMVSRQGGADGSFTELIFLLVALLVVDVVPILAFRLLGASGTEAGRLDARARTAAPQSSAGDVHEAAFAKLEPRWSGGPEGHEEATATAGSGEDKGIVPFGAPAGAHAPTGAGAPAAQAPGLPPSTQAPAPPPSSLSPSIPRQPAPQQPAPQQSTRHDRPGSAADEAAVRPGGVR
ncbi:hypothetical protein [Phaeacidiphilus oryzae]|uniref:hypothetical protein n=1 Tax=Phaeacidiphilus oryzae TaxID=348818 RepID=UPI0005613374|nr:hypothetical protein [Phaeacidiphilus oryzae]